MFHDWCNELLGGRGAGQLESQFRVRSFAHRSSQRTWIYHPRLVLQYRQRRHIFDNALPHDYHSAKYPKFLRSVQQYSFAHRGERTKPSFYRILFQWCDGQRQLTVSAYGQHPSQRYRSRAEHLYWRSAWHRGGLLVSTSDLISLPAFAPGINKAREVRGVTALDLRHI